MKYLSIFLIFYMVTLTLLPCRDSSDDSSATMPVIAVASNANAASDDCNDEFCPPFCICACCSVAKDFITVAALQIMVTEQVPSYIDYQMPAIAEQSAAIYQPPKVA